MIYGIVVVTYNRLDLLKVCLEHVMKQTKPYDRIIVINNCSTDGTEEYLGQLDGIYVKNLPQNSGGAGGFSAGTREAERLGCDWVTLIDDDAILDKDYLYTLVEWQRNNENVKAMCGAVYTKGKIALSYARRFLLSDKDYYVHVWNVPGSEYQKEYFYCDMASFCGITFSTELIKKIGYPDDRYFISFDDTEYTLRMRKITQIALVTGAHIDHRAYGASRRWKQYYNVRNELYTIKKYFGYRFAWEKTKQNMMKVNRFVRKNDIVREIKCMILTGTIDAWLGLLGKNKKFKP